MDLPDIEIEAKFLEVDVNDLKSRLRELGAKDFGEDLITEVIFYDKQMQWPKENKFVRIRTANKAAALTYKHDKSASLTGTTELEFKISDPAAAEKFLIALGLVAFRHQEKKRHSFALGDVAIDIDTWPQVPTYVEIEGKTEAAVKAAAAKLGFDWKKAVFGTASRLIETVYKIPVKSYHQFTFKKVQ